MSSVIQNHFTGYDERQLSANFHNDSTGWNSANVRGLQKTWGEQITTMGFNLDGENHEKHEISHSYLSSVIFSTI